MAQSELLSVVIPAYNEERFISKLLDKVRNVDLARFDLAKEIIVVDDGSKDRTRELVEAEQGVSLLVMEKNSGKGSAVRRGISVAKGDLVMIQDADLEYDPNDYVPMIDRLLSSGAQAVYGSRYMSDPSKGKLSNLIAAKHERQSWSAYLGGRSLSLVARVFTGHFVADTVTALKLFRSDVLQELTLRTTGFELDHELTAKILAHGHRIEEVPIQYFPRSREEGKKIGMRDWFIATRTFCRYRKG